MESVFIESEAVGLRTMDLSAEEKEVLQIYRRAKRLGYADVSATFRNGKREKVWLREKV